MSTARRASRDSKSSGGDVKQGDLFGAPPTAAPAKVEPPRAAAPLAAAPVAAAPPALPPAQPAWRAVPPPAPRPSKRVLSVGEITLAIKDALEPNFARVFVRGEVHSYRGPNARGHLYFSIKDEHATLEVRVWQSMARTLKFALRDGLSVIVEGGLNVFEPAGRYSLIAQKIEPDGVGAQALALEQLKQKLLAEGLFGARRSKPVRALPLLPKRIGVVTSVSGAALRDFLKIVHRRHPNAAVLVVDARVQGDDAAAELRRGLRALARQRVDVIVVTRGGGSSEDLMAFNDERLARLIFECPVPVVSAIGHEIDHTIADLVADVRAPTPSAAAELVVPVVAELSASLATARARLQRAMERRLLAHRHALQAVAKGLGEPRRALTTQRLRLNDLAERSARVLRRRVHQERATLATLSGRLERVRPQAQVRLQREALQQLARRLQASTPVPKLTQAQRALTALRGRLAAVLTTQLTTHRREHSMLAAQLDALSPLAVLGRGYVIAKLPSGAIVRSVKDVSVGDELRLQLKAGRIDAVVKRVDDDANGV